MRDRTNIKVEEHECAIPVEAITVKKFSKIFTNWQPHYLELAFSQRRLYSMNVAIIGEGVRISEFVVTYQKYCCTSRKENPIQTECLSP